MAKTDHLPTWVPLESDGLRSTRKPAEDRGGSEDKRQSYAAHRPLRLIASGGHVGR
jgi:hypothetical protein